LSTTEVALVLVSRLRDEGLVFDVQRSSAYARVTAQRLLEYLCSQPSSQSRFLLQCNTLISNPKGLGFLERLVLGPFESGLGAFSRKKMRKSPNFSFTRPLHGLSS